MGQITLRPTGMTQFGDHLESNSPNPLGDNNNGTWLKMVRGAGAILTYQNYSGSGLPEGRSVIAVRVGHRCKNETNVGLFRWWQGFPTSYLRVSGNKQRVTKAYRKFSIASTVHTVEGPPLYKSDYEPWTNAEISSMGTEISCEVEGPGATPNNRGAMATESYIILVYDEPVIAPTLTFPYSNVTIGNSSVNFSASFGSSFPDEQPIRAIFQVARDDDFSEDVRIFEADYATGESKLSRYTSIIGKDSYTDLGPGDWYFRAKGRDYRGERFESDWGQARKFSIGHPPLGKPELPAWPSDASVITSPYEERMDTIPSSSITGDRYVGIEWKFVPDSGVDASEVTWINIQDAIYRSGQIAYDPAPDAGVSPGQNGPKVSISDPSQYLMQGKWSGSARLVDKYLKGRGDWSNFRYFEVKHRPKAASLTPKADAAFDPEYNRIRWNFTDPWSGDSQSAYKVIISDKDGNEELYNTGKVYSSNNFAKVSLPGSRTEKFHRFSVQVWDQDDKSGAVETATFRMSRAPIVTLDSPEENEEIITGQPDLSWSVEFAKPGVEQDGHRVIFKRRDNAKVVHDTGYINGQGTSFSAPLAILEDLVDYRLTIEVTDDQGLTGVLDRNFSTNFIRPESTQTIPDVSTYERDGYVTVEWLPWQVDNMFVEWRVYRRRSGTDEWVHAGDVEDPSARTFRDWLVAGSDYYQWSVTQVAFRYGSRVESVHDENSESVFVIPGGYWVIVPGNESFNTRVANVVSDSFTEKREVGQYNIIGGGRRVNYGTLLGREGTLTVHVRASAGAGASEVMRRLRDIFNYNRNVILRDPFGYTTRIAIGEPTVDRMAGQVSEYADVEVPYLEVGEVK